jgi:hypothetical protein
MSKQRPFRLLSKPSSRNSYIRVIKKCFTFVILARLIGPQLCQSLFQWHLASTQRDAVIELWDDLCWYQDGFEPDDPDQDELPAAIERSDPEELLEDVDSDSPDPDMSDPEYFDDDDDDEEEEEEYSSRFGLPKRFATAAEVSLEAHSRPQNLDSELIGIPLSESQGLVDRLSELVLKLSIFMVTEEYSNGHPASCIMVYSSGILGMTEDGSAYKLIRNFTPNLSALLYYQ